MNLKLKYMKGKGKVSDGEDTIGEYLGSGDGEVISDKVNGSVTWDLFENQRKNICETKFFGKIKTKEKSEIAFTIMGLFKKPEENNKIWELIGSIYFDTSDINYEWLNNKIFPIKGDFDQNNYKHDYNINLEYK